MRLTNDGRLLINQATSPFNASLDVIGRSVGVRGNAVSTISAVNYGGWFTSSGSNSFGVRGDAVNSASGANYGVAGSACNGQTNNYAVYGQACNNNVDNWAGYFDGPTYSPGGVWTGSDENLKTNIEVLNGATEMLMNLQAKTYEFDTSVEALTLPEGLQYGFLAQELETVIPHAVRTINTPERFDDFGNIVVESMEFKGVDYSQIIPLLAAGFKEQNALEVANISRIEELQSRLHVLENAMAIATERENSSMPSQIQKAQNEKIKIEQIYPNPFDVSTTIAIKVLETGMLRIDIVNEQGKVLQTLINQNADAGSLQVIWNATEQPDGMYFCVIRHNGEIHVKKILKQ